LQSFVVAGTMSLTTQNQQLTKHQLPPIANQLNVYDRGLLVVLDAANLVQNLSPDSNKGLSPPDDLRQRLAAESYKRKLHFTTTKNAGPEFSLGNETQSKYSAQEKSAKAFLMKVYISPLMSPRSRKHDCAYYLEKRTNA
jgi:hypothetical protein